MSRVYLGIGSNLGDRAANLHAAFAGLDAIPGTRLVARAGTVETEPVGGPEGQPPFLNSAAVIETALAPLELLAEIHRLERSVGRAREREVRWGPRTLDIDILLWPGVVMNRPELVIPHPRLAGRAFALAPLAELAPDEPHPLLGTTVLELLHKVQTGK